MTMTQFMWEVDVPIEHSATGERGVHVFTGLAENGREARQAAQRAWEMALLHTLAGQDVPAATKPTDWSARGLRADWDMRWDQATHHDIER
ncbi:MULTISPECIES: hypothetical protein [unclassified Streptomyces]|uniref:hypothetical protein n=1 Tax=unclassified Streptomyces TaxID=2593676 RepID=UPI001BE75CD5|nr:MULTISPECIES: hypothetical protein [unclassified Streptomyces]MBT2406875.1 hypothetical protein [Streptomyces sp. ISL-21]MBT2613090.1 hypothetical protein [Streptomyces sp. ISL-87]